MKKIIWICLAALLLALPLGAGAEEAREITESCEITIPNCQGTPSLMLDRNRRSTASDWGKQQYEIHIAPGETPVATVYIEFGKVYLPFRVEARDGNGAWQVIAEYKDNTYPEAYVTFAPQSEPFRLVFYPQNGKKELAVRELFLLSEGEVGSDYNHIWQPPVEKADLLVLATHPDDEILWFGGVIPWYAGEKGMQVQVCYLTCTDFYRTLELLNGLWQCGVRNYPEIGDFFDNQFDTVDEVFHVWGRNTVEKHIVRLIRRYRPEVMLTQDVNGEYGHSQHKAGVQAALRAVELAADPEYDRQSAQQYGAWEVKKLYVHLGEHPTTVLDWSRPMAAFDGKNGFEMAEIAFQRHDSQLWTPFTVAYPGTAYDSTLYTLVRTTVGEEEAGNDFFEHIPAECLSVTLDE